MYIPKRYQETNKQEIIDFIEKNVFGTIVTTKNGKPIASHLPLQLYTEGDDIFITGHMAHANPQWKTLKDNNHYVPRATCLHLFFMV